MSLRYFVLLGLLVRPAFAVWEHHPEFQVLDEKLILNLETPAQTSEEFAGDMTAYARDARTYHSFLLSPIALQGSYGSVGMNHFFVDRRFRLRKEATENFELRFLHFNESQYESQSERNLIEGILWTPRLSWLGGGRLGTSLFSDLRYLKRSDALGYALVYQLDPTPDEKYELRLTRFLGEIGRNQQNPSSDRILMGFPPESLSLVGRRTAQDGFFEVALRSEREVQWSLPRESTPGDYDTDLVAGFSRRFASLHYFCGSDRPFEENFLLRLQWDRIHRTLSSLSPGVSIPGEGQWQRNRLLARTQLRLASLPELAWGVDTQIRSWRYQERTHTEVGILPHAEYSIRGTQRRSTQDEWVLGVILNRWSETGFPRGFFREERPPTGLSGDTFLQAKGIVRYFFRFSEELQASLQFSLDLDSPQDRIWDGGFGSFHFTF